MDQTHRHRIPLDRAGDAPNLLPNPGFEAPAPDDPRRPAGWVIDAQPPSAAHRTRRAPRTGRWALDAELALTPEGRSPETHAPVQLVTEHPVPVEPGARLAIGGSFRLDREPDARTAPDASVWIAGRWINTADNRRVVGSFFEFPGVALREGSYETRSAVVAAPAGADALIAVFILTGGDPTSGRPALLTIDDVFLRRVSGHHDRAACERDEPRHRRHTPDAHRCTQGPGPIACLTRPGAPPSPTA